MLEPLPRNRLANRTARVREDAVLKVTKRDAGLCGDVIGGERFVKVILDVLDGIGDVRVAHGQCVG